jgi:hypothetical protein
MPSAAAAKSSRTRPKAPPRRLRSVAVPRRVSGPARGRARPIRPSDRRGAPSLALGALGWVSRHPLLERLIRGRWSIALVAFALIGIVTLQLGLLQLNAGIGRTLLRERALERENATLSIENSALASGERIQQLASHAGMASVPLSALRFLRASYGTGVSSRAADALRAPVHRPEVPSASTTTAAGSQATSAASGESASTAGSSEASSTGAGEASGTGTGTGTGEEAPTASREGTQAAATGASSSEGSAAGTPATAASPVTGAEGGAPSAGG